MHPPRSSDPLLFPFESQSGPILPALLFFSTIPFPANGMEPEHVNPLPCRPRLRADTCARAHGWLF